MKKIHKLIPLLVSPIFAGCLVPITSCAQYEPTTGTWLDYFVDPGEEGLNKSTTAIGEAAHYKIDLKEAIPQDETLSFNISITGKSEEGVLGMILNQKLDDSRQSISFDGKVLDLTSNEITKDFYLDFQIEVTRKKGQQEIWKTIIPWIRINLVLEHRSRPDWNLCNFITIRSSNRVEQDIKIIAQNDWTYDGVDRWMYTKHPDVEYWDGYVWKNPGNWDKIYETSWNSRSEITFHLDASNDYEISLRGMNNDIETHSQVGGWSFFLNNVQGQVNEWVRSIVSIDTDDDSDNNAQITIDGSPLSLINYDIKGPEDPIDEMPLANCFSHLFSPIGDPNENIVTIIDQDEFLPWTKLKNNCYDSMFKGCTSLITAVNFPDIESNVNLRECFKSMFDGCRKLNITEGEGEHLIYDFTNMQPPLAKDNFKDMFNDTSFDGTPSEDGKYFWNYIV